MSQKTLAQKLFIKEESSVLIINQPDNYGSLLGELPKNVKILSEFVKNLDFIQLFATNKSDLENQLPELKKYIQKEGKIWISYPKGTSKMKSDINRDNLREYSLSIGLKAVSMISIDKNWSAMRLKVI